jgi:hypothetical protein
MRTLDERVRAYASSRGSSSKRGLTHIRDVIDVFLKELETLQPNSAYSAKETSEQRKERMRLTLRVVK